MESVNLTINGQKLNAPLGSTILQAAKLAKIDIPTLCDHPELTSVGACRICVVEVDGQRTLITACTFPIYEGMIVRTESERVQKARKLILELLFSERNHFCMYCQMSGSCELQNLGYRYGIDHWVYPTYRKPFDLDASREYFFMEHNRCVLCGRCERACGTLVANHTLGLRNRGSASMIHADANLSFDKSTCISCGTCLQVCPTGALCDKRSAFMGNDSQIELVESTCFQCSIGCGIKVVIRGGNIIRIDGDWNAPVNKGLLCKDGRFKPLYDGRKRVMQPLVKVKGKLQEATWEEAIQVVSDRIIATEIDSIGVLATSYATNEALFLISELFCKELQIANVALLNSSTDKIVDKPKATLLDITNSDFILIVGTDPANEQPVASFIIKRSVDKGARLVVVDDKDNGLSLFAYMNLKFDQIKIALDMALNFSNPIVLFGARIPKSVVEGLKGHSDKIKILPIESGLNTRAASVYGITYGFNAPALKLLYVMLGEQSLDTVHLLKNIGKDTFIIVQSCYESSLTEKADVLLPMAVWSEQKGSITNTEGRILQLNQVIEVKGRAKADWEIISLLAGQLGRNIGKSLDDISARAFRKLK